MLTLYHAIFQSHFQYGVLIWSSTFKSYLKKLIVLQNNALKIIGSAKWNERASPNHLKFKILRLPDMFKFESAVFTFKFNKQLLPSPFSHYFSKSNTKYHQLTRVAKSDNYFSPFYRTNKLQNSIKYHGPKFWNSLPIELKLCKPLKSFKIKLKHFFLNKYTC